MGEAVALPDRQGPGPAWHRVEREEPNPGSGWSRLWRGTNAQESTDRLVPPGQGGSATRTDSRGEQSFEAGVTAASTGESRHARDRSNGRRLNSAGLFDLTTAGKHLPGQVVVRGPQGLERRAARRGVESGRKLPSVSRRRWSTTNPQGSSGPRERVRLLGKGKLWRAAPRNASGMKEGREASGRHGEPADLARVRACRERSQNRREGQEP
jgi:hypothetical protein